MKNILNIETSKVTFILAIIFLAGFTACNEDEPNVGVETEIVSFGPTGVRHGEDITVIGTNLDEITSVLFKPAVEITEFKEHTSDRMVITVPDEAEPGVLLFKTPTQEIETKTIINFEVPVDIIDITGTVKPGEEITITGDKLNWIESITFPNDVIVLKERFVSQSANELKVMVPLEAQSGRIIFRTGGTEPLVFASESLLDVITPTITSFNPTSLRHESTLLIEGTNLDLVTEVVFSADVSVSQNDFENQSSTAIELIVPREAVQGKIVLKQVSPIDVESEQDLTIILPIGTSITPETQIPGISEVTIVGTDLDLVSSLDIPGSGAMNATEFTSQTAEQIVFDLPENASLGVVSYTTIHEATGSLGVTVIIPVDGPELGALLIPLYVDAVDARMSEGGGFGDAVSDFANTELIREGTNAIKATYTGSYAGSAQLGTWGKDAVPTAGAEVFAFSIYGTSDSTMDSLTFNLNLKNRIGPGEASNDNQIEIKIIQNEWVDFQIPLADFGGHDNVSEIFFQNHDWTGVAYIDRMGLDLEQDTGGGGLTPLTLMVFDEATSADFGEGGGFGGASVDYANTELSREGSVSIKVSYVGGFSGQPQFGTWGKPNFSLEGMSTLAFSIYGGNGSGSEIQVSFIEPGNDANPYEFRVAIDNGAWKEVEIPLSELGSLTEITQIRFQDTDWSGEVYIDRIGFR